MKEYILNTLIKIFYFCCGGREEKYNKMRTEKIEVPPMAIS